MLFPRYPSRWTGAERQAAIDSLARWSLKSLRKQQWIIQLQLKNTAHWRQQCDKHQVLADLQAMDKITTQAILQREFPEESN